MIIEILGPGCAKCESLVEKTREVANRLGLEYDLVKVRDFNEIANRGVLVTPALAVDGTVGPSTFIALNTVLGDPRIPTLIPTTQLAVDFSR